MFLVPAQKAAGESIDATPASLALFGIALKISISRKLTFDD